MTAPYFVPGPSDDEDDYDEPDDDGYASVNILGKDGMPRLLSAQCYSCIGRPGNKMDLRAGRVRQMIQDTLQGGGVIPCHQTLSYGDHPEAGGPAVCRWFYDAYGDRSNLVRIYDRLGGWTEVEPPQEDSDETEG